MTKSLAALQHKLAASEGQLTVLNNTEEYNLIPFQAQLEQINLYPLKPTPLAVFQVNVGKMCNQVCKHCHVDAGPDRKEIMTWDTMQQCITAIAKNPSITTVDLTGGAPEMNPNFRQFVTEIRALRNDLNIIVRCNLTIIVANKKYYDLPDFFKENNIEVVSSLPFYTADRTDKQRGDGVFEDSIKALQMLNAVGYGVENSGLTLNLVYNPAGAFLPSSQTALEQEYKVALNEMYNISFNNLFAITNLPISRYLDYLIQSGNYERYMQKLVDAFNPIAAANVMCRNTISIGWDGYLYDCDFNQMLDLKVDCATKHIGQFSVQDLSSRSIVVNQHCYGCTAGAGSSCGGTIE